MPVPLASNDSKSKPKDFRVAIVGGGIGGLLCAISLHKSGVAFDLFEAAAQFGEVGAGIGFAPNAKEPMRRLGILNEFTAMAIPRDRYTMLLGNESHDHVIDLLPHGGPLTSIHRAHMVDILVKHLPADSAHLNKRCKKVEQVSADPLLYRIHFSDGTTHEANLVIGADGIKSVARDAVLGRRVEPRYVGTRAFRGLFPADEWISTVGPEYASGLLIYSGLGKHLIIFPIDGNMINLVGFTSEPREKRFSPGHDALPAGESWVQPASYEQAAAEFADMDGPHVGAAFRAIDRMTVWKIHSLWPPLPTYVNGGVVLLGDAAHGMTPHCGQGAGQALEDAYILGQVLGHPETTLRTLEQKLRVYDQVRRPRANKVVEFSLETGDVWDGWGPSGESMESRREDASDRMDWIWQHDIAEDWKKALVLLESGADM